VLTDLALSCRENVRPIDMAGRYGGDEFVIVLPGASGQAATQVAARLSGQSSRTRGSDGSPIEVTLSIGVAEATGCRDLEALLARADLALYEAKRGGRARCHTFVVTEPSLEPVLPAA
jgi:diguanylate cyclase (GGDEF)-like protein